MLVVLARNDVFKHATLTALAGHRTVIIQTLCELVRVVKWSEQPRFQKILEVPVTLTELLYTLLLTR